MLQNNYFLAIFLSICIELTVGILFGYRRKGDLVAIALVTVVTHPILHYLLWLNSAFSWTERSLFLILFLEILAVLAEWLMLRYALRKDSGKLLLLSASMNAASFLAGILLFGI